jgi:hypothetical protein
MFFGWAGVPDRQRRLARGTRCYSARTQSARLQDNYFLHVRWHELVYDTLIVQKRHSDRGVNSLERLEKLRWPSMTHLDLQLNTTVETAMASWHFDLFLGSERCS